MPLGYAPPGHQATEPRAWHALVRVSSVGGIALLDHSDVERGFSFPRQSSLRTMRCGASQRIAAQTDREEYTVPQCAI